MTPGELLLKLYYRPVGRIRACIRNGGPLAERETERSRLEMEHSAGRLPSLPSGGERPTLSVHLLTGTRFWYQTVFCLHSLALASRCTIHAEIYDDGSLTAEARAQLLRFGPTIRIHAGSDLRDHLEQVLPKRAFPVLNERWRNYPNIRKLIDVHAGRSGWRLVIDSDMLFFRDPVAIRTWQSAPDRILHATDCEESYGYSRELLEHVAGTAIPPLVNVGVCGMQSDSIDWERLEHWTAKLHEREQTNYYLEQALVAMLAATAPHEYLPLDDYVTLPARDEVRNPTAVMHHYVAGSKRWYFRQGWRHFVPTPNARDEQSMVWPPRS